MSEGNASSTESAQTLATEIVITVAGSLSMVSTAIIILRFFLNRHLWNVSYHPSIFAFQFELVLITALCGGDFVQASSITLPVLYYWIIGGVPKGYSDSWQCVTQAFFQQIGCLSQFIWTFNVAYSTYKATVRETQRAYRIRKIVLCLVGLLGPLGLSLMQGSIFLGPGQPALHACLRSIWRAAQ